MTPADFEALVDDVKSPLGRFVAQMVGSRPLAEDVLQESFYVAWRDRATMPADEDLRRAWIFGVARNRALHALRKRRRGQRALETLAADALPASDEMQSDALAMRDLLIRVLSPEDRSLFVLRYVEGFSAPALAEMVGSTPAAVRKRLERSARALREALGHHVSIQEVHS